MVTDTQTVRITSTNMGTPQNVQKQLQIFYDYLKNKRLKITTQRKLIAESFLRTDGHLSTDELHRLVQKNQSNLGLATVFRTLKALTDCGLAQETTLNDGRTRFEHVYKRPHHHHIVCVECNHTIEFLSPEWEKIQQKIVAEYGFKTLRHNIKIFGVCTDCQNESKITHEVFNSDLVFERDALQIAMETEKRGVSFYKAASETVGDSSTKRAFLEMLKDEEEHLSEIKKQLNLLIQKNSKILEAPVFLHFDFETLKKIFPSDDEVREKLSSDLSSLQALKLAMDMELEAYNFFNRYAERFNDTTGRDIFMKFAQEEQEHYSTIKQEYDRLASETVPS